MITKFLFCELRPRLQNSLFTMPTLAYYHATAAAAATNLTKYFEMTNTDHDKTQQITDTLSHHTTQIARMGALANASTAQQLLCVFQGTP